MRQAPLQTQIRLYNLRMVEEEEKSVPVQAAPSKSVLETVIAFDYPFVKVNETDLHRFNFIEGANGANEKSVSELSEAA